MDGPGWTPNEPGWTPTKKTKRSLHGNTLSNLPARPYMFAIPNPSEEVISSLEFFHSDNAPSKITKRNPYVSGFVSHEAIMVILILVFHHYWLCFTWSSKLSPLLFPSCKECDKLHRLTCDNKICSYLVSFGHMWSYLVIYCLIIHFFLSNKFRS